MTRLELNQDRSFSIAPGVLKGDTNPKIKLVVYQGISRTNIKEKNSLKYAKTKITSNQTHKQLYIKQHQIAEMVGATLIMAPPHPSLSHSLSSTALYLILFH